MASQIWIDANVNLHFIIPAFCIYKRCFQMQRRFILVMFLSICCNWNLVTFAISNFGSAHIWLYELIYESKSKINPKVCDLNFGRRIISIFSTDVRSVYKYNILSPSKCWVWVLILTFNLLKSRNLTGVNSRYITSPQIGWEKWSVNFYYDMNPDSHIFR